MDQRLHAACVLVALPLRSPRIRPNAMPTTANAAVSKSAAFNSPTYAIPHMAIRAAAVPLSTNSKMAMPNKIVTAVSRFPAAPLHELIARNMLMKQARSEEPIEIDMAIEAGFTAPSIMGLHHVLAYFCTLHVVHQVVVLAAETVDCVHTTS